MLHLSVGIPGSGKSTYAKEYCALHSIEYVSSDELRAKFGTGEDDQSVSAKVFAFIEQLTHRYMSEGRDLFIDATHYNRKGRKRAIAIATKYGAQVTAHVSRVPFEVCKARNAARARVVPDFVLQRMYAGFEWPTIGEVDDILYFGAEKKD